MSDKFCREREGEKSIRKMFQKLNNVWGLKYYEFFKKAKRLAGGLVNLLPLTGF